MIKFLKTTEYEVKSPIFEQPANAGIDIFVPSNTEAFNKAFKAKNPSLEIENDGTIRVPPHGDALIPTGLYTKIPENVALIVYNKSGVATKKKLVKGAEVVDYSYQGIFHAHVVNTSHDWQIIKCDEKLIQVVPVLIDISGVTVDEGIKPEEWFDEKTDRGAGGFGSTGLV